MTFPWIWRLHFMGWPGGGREEEKIRKKSYTERNSFSREQWCCSTSTFSDLQQKHKHATMMSSTRKRVIITVVIDLHVKLTPQPQIKPRETFDAAVLATGTHHPGSGCCTSCTRSRRPLYVRTPLQPRQPSPDGPASRLHTRRRAPVDESVENTNTQRMSHRGTEALGCVPNITEGYCDLCGFTHNYVFLCDSGMQVVHRYFCPLQWAESRLERNMKPHDQALGIKVADREKCLRTWWQGQHSPYLTSFHLCFLIIKCSAHRKCIRFH